MVRVKSPDGKLDAAADAEILDAIYAAIDIAARLIDAVRGTIMAKGMGIEEFVRRTAEISAQYEHDRLELGENVARTLRNRAILALGSEEEPGYVKDPENENSEEQDL